MTLQAVHPLPSGIASSTTLRPVAGDSVPVAAQQATLPFGVDHAPGLPRRPELSIVTGSPSGLEAFAARLAQAVVEVMSGDRGVHQLMRWTTESVYADLLRRTHTLQRVAPGELRQRRVRAQVRSVHLCRPRDGVAELSVHVRHGQRSRALAARIELVEARWRCTVLEFG
ncbi:MAG TPA: Rv3235 family protein [Marmoricola sp.]|jgi:hypothetical protein|nr:Rv3235 family protein [Marmoricola sp.]